MCFHMIAHIINPRQRCVTKSCQLHIAMCSGQLNEEYTVMCSRAHSCPDSKWRCWRDFRFPCARGTFLSFWIGLAGVACGVLYVAPGINLAKRGIGEFAIALAFGLCCVNGAYFIQVQALNIEVLFASLPVAMLITLVLYINEFPDYKADKAVGKTHWVVRLGRKRAATGYTIMMILTYVLIIALALIFGKMWLLIGLLTIPIALKTVRNTLINYDNVKALFPSCAGMIMTHLLTGLLLTSGYVLQTLL